MGDGSSAMSRSVPQTPRPGTIFWITLASWTVSTMTRAPPSAASALPIASGVSFAWQALQAFGTPCFTVVAGAGTSIA